MALTDTHPPAADMLGAVGRKGRVPQAAYVALGAGLMVLCGFTAAAGEWVSDTWIHAATISEVARRPLEPLEPLTGSQTTFPYFSPYAMALGWVMYSTGVSAMSVLTLGGLLSTGLMLWALWRLVRALTVAPWAPVMALTLMITLWGISTMWFWSGFFVLGTWSVGFTWPSVLAAAAWFELWRVSLRLTTVSRPALIGAFVVLPGMILLIHPFTALIAALAVGVTLLSQLRFSPRRVGIAVLAGAGSVALAAFWPWIEMSDLLGQTAGFDEIHAMLYEDFVARNVFLLLTVPALLWRLRRDWLDPLFWTALVLGTGVAVGAFTEVWSLARLLPGVAICGQLALAVLLTTGWTSWRALGAVARAGVAILTAATVIAMAAGAWAQRGVVARALPGEERRAHYELATSAQLPYPDLSFVEGQITEGDVAIANEWRMARQLPAHGLYTVHPPWPSPGLPDAPQRAAAAKAIFNPSTSQPARDRLIAQWRIRWIVWVPSDAGKQWPHVGARLVACGRNGAALLRIDPAVDAPAACPH